MKVKRAGKLLIASVGSLLLAGCDGIPSSLEEFFDWREKFFFHVDTGEVTNLLGPVVAILVVFAVIVSLGSILRNLRHLTYPWEGTFFTGITVLICAGLILVFVPIATAFGQSIMPADLTLDKVFQAMHWELSTDPMELVTITWAISFTLLLPLVSAFWEIVMLVSALIAVAISISGRSIKGVVFVFAQVFGWGLFLTVYHTVVSLIGEYYPTWNLPWIPAAISTLYLVATVGLMLACYIGVPWLAASLVPSRSESESIAVRSARERRIDLNDVLAFPVPVPVGNFDRDDRGNSYSEQSTDEYAASTSRSENVHVNRSTALLPPPTNENPQSQRSGESTDPPTGPQGNSGGFTGGKPKGNFGGTSSHPEHHSDNHPKIDSDDLLSSASSASYEQPAERHRSEKRAKTFETVSKVLSVTGAVTGKSELLVGAQVVKYAGHVSEELERKDADPKKVLVKESKGLVNRAAKSMIPELSGEDLLTIPEDEGGAV